VRFIFSCFRDDNLEELPPPPLARKDEHGKLVAIDGHNLIAARQFRGEEIEVIVSESSTDGLPPTTEANKTRNEELAAKFDSVLDDRRKIAAEGIVTFADLVTQYEPLFAEVSA